MTFEAKDMQDLAFALVPAALRAGAAIMANYRPEVAVRYKDDRSPVTDADHAAEEIVLAALAKIMPGVPVIAEEAAAKGVLPDAGECFFLVDPLDGTKEFIKGNGEFTVNIALVSGNSPRFGLIYAPALKDCYFTMGPRQAVRCALAPSAAAAVAPAMDLQPLTGEAPPSRPFTAITSRSHQTPDTLAFLADIPAPSARITLGSSLKFCMLARGDADVYPRFGPTSEWDTAAGHAILEAAGGRVLTAEGAPLLYGKKEARFINPSFIAWRRYKDASAA